MASSNGLDGVVELSVVACEGGTINELEEDHGCEGRGLVRGLFKVHKSYCIWASRREFSKGWQVGGQRGSCGESEQLRPPCLREQVGIFSFSVFSGRYEGRHHPRAKMRWEMEIRLVWRTAKDSFDGGGSERSRTSQKLFPDSPGSP